MNNLQFATPNTVFRRLPGKYMSKIGITTLEGTHILNVNTIVYCEAKGNYTKIYTSGEKSIMVSKTLKNFDTHLSKATFKRCHNSYLINIDEVVQIGDCLEMSNGAQIPISRSKKNQVKEWFSDIVSFI